MHASTYVGRVGGLAVALGVGAAVLGGTAVAYADDPAGSDSSAANSESTQAGPAAGRGARGDAAAPTGRRGSPVARSAAAAEPSDSVNGDPLPELTESNLKPTNTIQRAQVSAPADVEPAESEPADLDALPAAVAEPAPTAAVDPVAVVQAPPAPAPEIAAGPADGPADEPVAAPASAPVAAFLSAAVSAPGDPVAGDNTGAPADSPLDWTMLAFARRQTLNSGSAQAQPAAAVATTLPLILGPSGVPIPSEAYGQVVMDYYIPDGTPGTQQLVFTPEGLYPITGVKSLPLNTSVDQGVEILSDTLGKVPAGTPTTVFGYSQSAIIASLLKADGGYTTDKGTFTLPSDVPVSLVLVGNEMNPDGGFLSRFSGRDMPLFSMPSLGIDFYGATPSNAVPVTNYAREYDGFADFPRYPINFLSDLNAGLGIVYVHTEYAPIPGKCKSYCLTKEQVQQAIALPSTSDSQKYYFIPTEDLPLLQPLRMLPFIGTPLADLLNPSLKVLVDLGYGDQAHGFETGIQPNANELQPFGVFPQVALTEVVSKTVAGIQKGIQDFINDLGPQGSMAMEAAAASESAAALASSGDFITTVQTLITDVSNYIAGSVSSVYAALLPTADIITAIVATLPAYDVNLFLYGMQQAFSGQVIDGLVNAVGLPVAADVGLVTTAGLVGALVWAEAVAPVFGAGGGFAVPPV